MDAQVRRRRTYEAIKRILLRESLNQPLMVIVEDLHWTDSETQALLNLLVDAIANARILLLVNYRPSTVMNGVTAPTTPSSGWTRSVAKTQRRCSMLCYQRPRPGRILCPWPTLLRELGLLPESVLISPPLSGSSSSAPRQSVLHGRDGPRTIRRKSPDTQW